MVTGCIGNIRCMTNLSSSTIAAVRAFTDCDSHADYANWVEMYHGHRISTEKAPHYALGVARQMLKMMLEDIPKHGMASRYVVCLRASGTYLCNDAGEPRAFLSRCAAERARNETAYPRDWEVREYHLMSEMA